MSWRGDSANTVWKHLGKKAERYTNWRSAHGMRWPIETCFAEGKEELGMDHYKLRFWRGWHHHMTLVILAHHFLVRWQQRLNQREGGLAPDNHLSFIYAR